MDHRFPSLALLTVLACQSEKASTPDAGLDTGAPEAPIAGEDAGISVLAVDFTVTGCPDLDPVLPRCSGRSPLTVEFIPIVSIDVTRYLWDFGDGSQRSSDRTPSHTYFIPGSYDVSLVGGGSTPGTASKIRAGFMVVTPSAAGEPCDVDDQCETGVACVCGSAARCGSAFPRGLCAESCRDSGCPGAQVCADLSGGAVGAQAWQAPLCLRACASDGDCAIGLRCRDLPGRAGWVRGCFPDHPSGVGGPCRSAADQLRADLCVTGQCFDLGALGICSLDCTRESCPTASACVEMSDGRRLCLRECANGLGCNGDPLLACIAPNPGPFGFTVPSGAPGVTYCAPKRCATAGTECGLVGHCREDQNGAHCVRKPG